MMGDVAPADFAHVGEWVAGTAMFTTAIGVGGQRLLARRSIGLQVALVAVITVVTALAAVSTISAIMLTASDREAMFELMGIAGLAGFAVALVISRSITRGARKLLGAVKEVGESGFFIPPPITLPTELSGLSEGLAEAHERLGAARAREQSMEVGRRELVAWVSHDLRTPLAGLRAMTEALEDGIVSDPEGVADYHRRIRRQTDRMTRLVDDLFELARINAGALRLSLANVSLGDIISDAVASAVPL